MRDQLVPRKRILESTIDLWSDALPHNPVPEPCTLVLLLIAGCAVDRITKRQSRFADREAPTQSGQTSSAA